MQNSKSMMAVTAFLILLPVFIFFNVPYINNDAIVIITFIINAILFSGGILFELKRYSFSLNLMYWIFMYFFMFLAPFIQYTNNKYPWEFFAHPTEDEIFINNILIIIFSLMWILGGRIKVNKQKKKTNKVESYLTTEFIPKYNKKYLILLIISVVLASYALLKFGLRGIISSRAESSNKFYSGNNQSIDLIIGIVFPAVLTYAAIMYFVAWKREKKHFVEMLICMASLVICFFPTTVARYKAATIYIALLIVIWPKMRKGSTFFWVLLGGLFFIFLFLNLFRYSSDMTFLNFFINLKDNFIISYTEGHYDAYESLIIATRYIKIEGCTYGRQLMGAILFFIPRGIWPSKSIGSGAFLAEYFSPGSFSNISCTFSAECLINGGWLGFVFLPLLFGFLFTKIDFVYHNKKDERAFGVSPYILLTPLIFFVLRGDLMSSFSYTFGFMLTGFFIKIFIANDKNRTTSPCFIPIKNIK